MFRPALNLLGPVVVGVIIALATGISTLTSNLSFYYGVPLGWRLAFCPIVQPFGCPLYNWLAFFLDALFFTAIGYVVLTIVLAVLRRLE